MVDTEDVWVSDEDDIIFEKKVSSKEWERLNENFGNVGYKEGIVEGKDMTIQEGFDKGYSEGFNVGKELGRLRGLLNTLIVIQNKKKITENNPLLEELKNLEKELANLTFDKIFTKEYFESNYQEKVNQLLIKFGIN
ncbi:2483_t:CDS:2 [Entrophospora sp. SA101]|nr:6348_t:CDS:2 [Entrophospora sp. SA101]CAJ0904948.1 2483_t:CDS:2 [Entrophospora sp. SA101]